MHRMALFLLCFAAMAQTRPPQVVEIGGANLPAQRIGANDLIAISVYDSPEFSRTVRISSEGQIRLPMLRRRIKAEGLLPSELEVAIADALQDEELIVDPVVTITVVEYHSRPISVAGEVKNPLTFQAVGKVTLLDAITQAGGLSPNAGPEILVSRTQRTEGEEPATLVQRIPVKGLIDAADPELNIKLVGEEEIRVPEVGKIFVVGNIKRPGAYAVQDGSETTVLQILALAEGLAPYSSKEAYIYRRDGASGAKHEIRIELTRIMERKSPDVPLLADDIFYVPDNKGRRATMGALEKLIGFGSATASGVLIWGAR
jgi:polysaccharide export outer membrane protein